MIDYARMRDVFGTTDSRPINPDRRRLIRLGVAGAFSTSALFASGILTSGPVENTSNLRIAAQIHPDNPDDVALVQQMGVKYLSIWATGDYDFYRALRKKTEDQELQLATCSGISNQEEIVLGMPGRDKIIDAYKRSLINMGRAGLTYRTVSFMANGIWTTHRESRRGGAMSRAYTEGRPPNAQLSYGYKRLTFDRKYTEEELWDNYAYFIRQVAPVAEEAGVRIGIHPEDPPGLTLGNVPRVVGSSFAGYKRALEIADSPNVGLCLCVGVWLEGGERMGKDVCETIKYFGERDKLFKVHFRNVSSPLPDFVESWLDDGYYDMYKVMKALREVNRDTVIIADHWPGKKTGGYNTGLALCTGYMQALLARANDEVGG